MHPFQGSLTGSSFTLPAGSVTDAAIPAGAAISASKLGHRNTYTVQLFGPTTTITALTQWAVMVRGATGTLISIAAAIAVQATDISRVAASVDKKLVMVFAQHIDTNGQGKSTGFVTADAVKEAGAVGTLLNHAEHKITDIAKRVSLGDNQKMPRSRDHS